LREATRANPHRRGNAALQDQPRRYRGQLDRAKLPFYRGLLEPIGWSGLREVDGEQGEPIYYLSVEGPGVAALGLREKRSEAHERPV
jgi:hypothetical protein